MRFPKPGTALGFLALFVALTGGAYAAISLPKNSVTTRQVKDRSLLARDFKRGQIPRGARGPVGPVGAQGIQGVQGGQGPAGPVGTTGVANIVITQGTTTLCSGTVQCSVGIASATCPAGMKPLGGGVLTAALNGTFAGSISNSNGYVVGGDNYGSSTTAELDAFAYCSADVKSVRFPDGTTMRPMTGNEMASLVARKFAAH